jgi:hypothetical protein
VYRIKFTPGQLRALYYDMDSMMESQPEGTTDPNSAAVLYETAKRGGPFTIEQLDTLKRVYIENLIDIAQGDVQSHDVQARMSALGRLRAAETMLRNISKALAVQGG